MGCLRAYILVRVLKQSHNKVTKNNKRSTVTESIHPQLCQLLGNALSYLKWLSGDTHLLQVRNPLDKNLGTDKNDNEGIPTAGIVLVGQKEGEIEENIG